jgi:hypothetical protein
MRSVQRLAMKEAEPSAWHSLCSRYSRSRLGTAHLLAGNIGYIGRAPRDETFDMSGPSLKAGFALRQSLAQIVGAGDTLARAAYVVHAQFDNFAGNAKLTAAGDETAPEIVESPRPDLRFGAKLFAGKLLHLAIEPSLAPRPTAQRRLGSG